MLDRIYLCIRDQRFKAGVGGDPLADLVAVESERLGSCSALHAVAHVLKVELSVLWAEALQRLGRGLQFFFSC
jgi:hypothetical protein